MNKTLNWAFAGACLTGILGCRLSTRHQSVTLPVSSAAYSENVDCSGHSENDRLPATSGVQVPAQARLPYAYRWDEYQGSDIEHDIYGQRQRAASLRAITHPQLVPEVARKLNGFFTAPGHRTCAVPHCTTSSQAAQIADPIAENGSEQAPTPPDPVPLTTVPGTPEVEPPATLQPAVDPPDSNLAPAAPPPKIPTPAEPVPTEPVPTEPAPTVQPAVPPRNVVPRPMPRTSATPTAPQPEGAKLEQSTGASVPPTQLPAVPSKISIRLIPTLIVPAEPPPPLPDTQGTENPRQELRRNKIPGKPPKEPTDDR